MFGTQFWENCAIVITRYSNNPAALKKRSYEDVPVTKLSKRKDLNEILGEGFPESLKYDIPLFFVDSDDIGYPFDETLDQASRLVDQAFLNPDYDC